MVYIKDSRLWKTFKRELHSVSWWPSTTTRQSGGGVATFTRNDLKTLEIKMDLMITIEVVAIKIDIQEKVLAIINICVPPHCTTKNAAQEINRIFQYVKLNSNWTHCTVIGDFNAPHLFFIFNDHESPYLTNTGTALSPYERELLKTMNTNIYEHIYGVGTRFAYEIRHSPIIMKIIDVYALPILEHCSIIWNRNAVLQTKLIERIQHKACRLALRTPYRNDHPNYQDYPTRIRNLQRNTLQ